MGDSFKVVFGGMVANRRLFGVGGQARARRARPCQSTVHPDRSPHATEQPRLDRCNPACANIARTDQHIEALSDVCTSLKADVANPLTPQPIRARLAQRLAALTQVAERHRRLGAVDAHR